MTYFEHDGALFRGFSVSWPQEVWTPNGGWQPYTGSVPKPVDWGAEISEEELGKHQADWQAQVEARGQRSATTPPQISTGQLTDEMLEEANIISDRYADAVASAIKAHAGQVRKGTSIPYVSHPIAVSALVLEHGGDEDQAIGGLLHDVVEDCPGVTPEMIGQRFGPRVQAIVEGCTDGVAGADGKKPPWRERKEAYLHRLGTAPQDVLLVSACDKLHNARSIEADFAMIGDKVFERFTAGKAGTEWYYNSLLAIFIARLGNAALVTQLSSALQHTYGSGVAA